MCEETYTNDALFVSAYGFNLQKLPVHYFQTVAFHSLFLGDMSTNLQLTSISGFYLRGLLTLNIGDQ